MFTISISPNSLKALALIAAKEDVRFYLKTVCVDLTTAGRVHVVTCDGHRALIVGNATLEGERVAGRFLVPCEALKGIKPLAKGAPIMIDIEPKGSQSGSFVIRGNVTVSGELIDANYPDWHRIVPKVRELKSQGKPSNFQFKYVGEFGRVAELLELPQKSPPHIVQHGEDASVVWLGSDAFGILMPIRYGKAAEECHFVNWLDAVETAAAPAAIAA